MFIENVRIGFATNSSSTHSIVFYKPGSKWWQDYVPGHSFGWENFILVSQKLKQKYLDVTFRDAILRAVKERDVAEVVVQQLLGRHLDEDEEYVDHQSRIEIPTKIGQALPNMEYYEDLKKSLLRENVAILGGNDNDDDHPLVVAASGSVLSDFVPVDQGGDLVARKDGDFWTVFNRNNGTKVRFSFLDHPKDAPPRRPELVDLKITDFCPHHCSFCYQDSSSSGRWAEYSDLYNIICFLKDLEVFEIAIGGGEPTTHPEFLELLQEVRKAGMVPNFTTRSLDWLRNGRIWPRAIDLCGQFAYSVNCRQDVQDLLKLLQENGINAKKCSINVPLGTVSRADFVAILDALVLEPELEAALGGRLSLTLLGFKPLGRGSSFKKIPYEWWLEEIKKAKERHGDWHLQVGIDTHLAAESASLLKGEKVSELLYRTKEGFASCYIDAVNKTLARSSYEGRPRPLWRTAADVLSDPKMDKEKIKEYVAEHVSETHYLFGQTLERQVKALLESDYPEIRLELPIED